MKIIEKIFAPIKALLISNYVGSFVRTALAGVAGYLVAKGIATTEQANTLVDILLQIFPGLSVYLLSQFASLANKQKK